VGPYALTPNTVELIPTIGAFPPRGGPVEDPVLTEYVHVAQDGPAPAGVRPHHGGRPRWLGHGAAPTPEIFGLVDKVTDFRIR